MALRDVTSVFSDVSAFRSLLVGFGVTVLVTPVLIRLAPGFGWIAQPRFDRWHRCPVALMGGIAIMAGVLVGILSVGIFTDTWAELLIASALCVLGGIDDRLRLSPRFRVLCEVVAAVAVVGFGYRFAPELPATISVVLTVLWIVGIVNALNLMDNMDGLASGVAAVSSFCAGLICMIGHDLTGAAIGFAVTGGTVAFLVFNSRPANIFMGDAGSLSLGFLLAIVALRAGRVSGGEGGLLLSFFIPVCLNASLIADTSLVTVARVINGRSISQGGRDHVSHRLVNTGLSESAAVGTIIVVAAVVACVPLVDLLIPGHFHFGFVTAACLLLAVLLAYCTRHEIYMERSRVGEDALDQTL